MLNFCPAVALEMGNMDCLQKSGVVVVYKSEELARPVYLASNPWSKEIEF